MISDVDCSLRTHLDTVSLVVLNKVLRAKDASLVKLTAVALRRTGVIFKSLKSSSSVRITLSVIVRARHASVGVV